jgi:hypothetical protein
MPATMKATPETPAEPFSAILARWLAVPRTGDILTVLFGLLFLFLCMILPLVGKTAAHGSGSPGAGPMDTLWKNHLFFSLTLLLTLLAGSGAMASKLLRRRTDGSAYPKFTAGLLAVCGLLLLCYAAGLLKL